VATNAMKITRSTAILEILEAQKPQDLLLVSYWKSMVCEISNNLKGLAIYIALG
jgi:hypothetical protein